MVYISNGMITTRLTVYETSQSANPLLSKLGIIIAGDFNIDTGSKNCIFFVYPKTVYPKTIYSNNLLTFATPLT